MKLRNGKITHRFNVNAKEFIPSLKEYLYLNKNTGQLIYIMATTKNLPSYLHKVN